MAGLLDRDMCDVGCDELKAAIIRQAIDDYRKARRKLSWEPGDIGAARLMDDVTRFFRGKWCGMLLEIDPELILEKLRKEVD